MLLTLSLLSIEKPFLSVSLGIDLDQTSGLMQINLFDDNQI